MRDINMFEEIIEIGKRRGVLTYDEINEALPPEFYSPSELEDFMDLLTDLGVKIVEDGSSNNTEEEEEPTPDTTEKTEDLVQAYFHSMGDISILTKDEEGELARKIESGKKIIAATVMDLPIARRLLAEITEADSGKAGEAELRNAAVDRVVTMLRQYMIEIRKYDAEPGFSESSRKGAKKEMASSTVISSTWLILFPRYLTSSTRG